MVQPLVTAQVWGAGLRRREVSLRWEVPEAASQGLVFSVVSLLLVATILTLAVTTVALFATSWSGMAYLLVDVLARLSMYPSSLSNNLGSSPGRFLSPGGAVELGGVVGAAKLIGVGGGNLLVLV